MNTRVGAIFSLAIAVFAALFVSLKTSAQSPPALTAEWIFSEQGHAVAAVPQFQWLADNTAILYDTRQTEAQRTFEKYDPVTQKRQPMVEMSKAVASLKSIDLSAIRGQGLPWPEVFDKAGRQAAYVFHGDLFLLDLPASKFVRITDTPSEEKDPEFSPDGSKLAFVRGHDIYVYEIAAKRETRLTSDGSEKLLNGTLSWVYWEEIFGRHDTGYWWSPDSRSIAFLQTDESDVPVSTFVDFQPAEEHIIRQPYPKPGMHNPRVRVGVVTLGEAQTRWLILGEKPYEWVLRVNWLPDSERLAVQTMPRVQSESNLDFINCKSGERRHVLTENDPAWVNVSDDLDFLPGGKQFLWSSDRDGFTHIYKFAMDGSLVNKVTEGDWSVGSSGGVAYWVHKAIVGIDSQNDWIYFTALKDSSIERHLYRVKSDGTSLSRITSDSGFHGISMSPNAKYYFDVFSDARTLPALKLFSAEGKLQQTLAAPRPELLPANMQYREFLTILAADGFAMPASILKPANFDPAHKYPVILYVYGGPSAPSVLNSWSSRALFTDQLLLQAGFVVVTVDNRAATAISKKLEDTIAQNPAASETADLLDAVRWFKAQPWVDGSRFGVWGWSGGGTMTLNLMTRSAEFKAGISVAPVTDWHYYDSKWAESLMGLPDRNPEGYERTSLVKHAGDLSGHLMVVFGTYDDNVHPQNEQAFINELIAKDILFELMIYPMRKHGISDAAASVHLFRTMDEFWRRNL